MLELLSKLGGVAKPGFTVKTVRWALDFTAEGRFLDVVELGQTEAKRNPGREFPKCPELGFSLLIAGGIPKAQLLVDTPEVVLLLSKQAEDPKLQAKHRYFVDLLEQAAEAMPELAAVAATLRRPEVLEEARRRLAEQKPRPGDKVTLRLGGAFAVDSEAWHDWWRQFRRSLEGEGPTDTPLMPCLVSGELVQPAPTHPKIKGLAGVGGAATGDVLIGFDKPAFTSYGLEQSHNAPVGEEATAQYVAGLNDLISKHSQRLAGATVGHWFKEEVPQQDDPLPWLTGAQGEGQAEVAAQAQARRLLTAIRAGGRPDLAGNYYYALTLSGMAGRVMVRDWMEGQFEELVANVLGWFEDLAIAHRNGDGLAPDPKFMAVLGATVRRLDDLPAPFVARMWRVAVRGEPIPQSALVAALLRFRSAVLQDEVPNHARLGLMRACLVRKYRKDGDSAMSQSLTPYLNPEHPSPAYHCGRLMAVLSALQRAALGDVGAGVVQRYYAAASSTPALVLGRLVRTSQFHLDKLESGGLRYWYEMRLADIFGRLRDEIPATLGLEEQSLFALGYYQQLADLRTRKALPEQPAAEADETAPEPGEPDTDSQEDDSRD